MDYLPPVYVWQRNSLTVNSVVMTSKLKQRGVNQMNNYKYMLRREQDVLTVQDVARILRIGKNYTYDLIRSGRIPAMKLGKRILIPKAALIDFLEGESSYRKNSEKNA